MNFSKIFNDGKKKSNNLKDFLPEYGLDINNIQQYLSLRYCIEPKTIVKSVLKEIIIQNPEVDKSSFENIILSQKPKKPYGVLLSGGIDSSILAKLYDDKDVVFVFVQTLLGQERKYFDSIASTLKGKIEIVTLTEDIYYEYAKYICENIDEPVGDAAIISVYTGAKRLKELGINTVIVGEGGDEAFGGYWGYVDFEKGKLQLLNYQIVKNHIGMAFNKNIPEVKEYWSIDRTKGDRVLQAMWWDRFMGLKNLFLWKNIRGTELAGCDCILPFAHQSVWDWMITNLTSKDRVDLLHPFKKKIWLKHLALKLGVPKFCVDREKMGFRSEGNESILKRFCNEMKWQGKYNMEIFAMYSLWAWCKTVNMEFRIC